MKITTVVRFQCGNCVELSFLSTIDCLRLLIEFSNSVLIVLLRVLFLKGELIEVF